MATIEDAIAAMVQLPALAAVIADRAYPVDFTDDPVYPSLLWMIVSNPRGYTMSGGADGLVRARVQLDCYSDTYDGAVALKKAVFAVFDGYSGTIAGVQIQHSTITMEHDAGDSGLQRAGVRVRRKLFDVNLKATELP